MQKQSFVFLPIQKGRLSILMIVLLGMSSLAMATPSSLRITIGTFAPYYSPTLVHIRTGTPIAWDNPTGALHSITHDECQTGKACAFDSGPLGPNQTFTLHHLPPAGSYPYHCSFHPIMRGILVVINSDSSSET